MVFIIYKEAELLMKNGSNYNIDQMTLEIFIIYYSTSLINDFIDSLNIDKNYIFKRLQVYFSGIIKVDLIWLYYPYRKIEIFARENKYAEWIVQTECSSYRMIVRFIT